jgi:MFS family permease
VLIAATYISTGLLLPGMDVGSQTAILNRSPERNRSMYIALYSCVTTLLGRAFANAAGGWLLDNPLLALEKMNAPLFGMMLNRYNYLFLLSFILRVVSAFILLPRMISPDD